MFCDSSSANHESDFSTFHEKIVVKYGGKGGKGARLLHPALSQVRQCVCVCVCVCVCGH